MCRISELGSSKKLLLSSFDAANGYHQILVHPQNWPVLAFKQAGCSIIYTRISQSLAASAYVFSNLIYIILGELNDSLHHSCHSCMNSDLKWAEQCQILLDQIKADIAASQGLALPDLQQEFSVLTDCSDNKLIILSPESCYQVK